MNAVQVMPGGGQTAHGGLQQV